MIIYFSGTGNTAHLAKRLAELTGDTQLVELQKELLLHPEQVDIEVSGARVVWMFPTYSWGLPPVVVGFIKAAKLRSAGDVPHFMVTTCGDDIGNTDRQWRKLMAHRQWRTMNAYSVTMPNTYVMMKGFDVDSDELANAKMTKGETKIAEIAQAITTNPEVMSDVVRGSWAWVKSAIIYPYFIRFCMSPKPFHATDGCIACGKCAKVCPMDNITQETTHPKRPIWHSKCALCHRCYHACPVHAVAYGKATEDKGQFNHWLKQISNR